MPGTPSDLLKITVWDFSSTRIFDTSCPISESVLVYTTFFWMGIMVFWKIERISYFTIWGDKPPCCHGVKTIPCPQQLHPYQEIHSVNVHSFQIRLKLKIQCKWVHSVIKVSLHGIVINKKLSLLSPDTWRWALRVMKISHQASLSGFVLFV